MRLNLNIKKMMSNKEKSVQVLTKGVEFLFKKNKVTYLKGKGVIFSKNDVVVYNKEEKKIIQCKKYSNCNWIIFNISSRY